MNDLHNSELSALSRTLRKNMTPQERKLWYDFLKPLPIVFKRQKIIGRYIVDFYCPSMQLVIELDGGQHYEKQGRKQDALRDEDLQSLGLRVLRYSNDDVMYNFDGVCEDILRNLSLIDD